jgi:hypothetical protein
MALLAMVALRVRNGQTLIAQTGTRRRLRLRKGALDDFSVWAPHRRTQAPQRDAGLMSAGVSPTPLAEAGIDKHVAGGRIYLSADGTFVPAQCYHHDPRIGMIKGLAPSWS